MSPPQTGIHRSLASRDFLRHHERLLRPALDTWALELHQELDGLNVKSATDPSQLDAISACMNKASFVVASTGHLASALHMCESQLTWVAQRSQACSDAGILNHAIQPWINIGRLHALRGDRKSALPHFRLAERFSHQEPAVLGPCHLTADTWPAVIEAAPEVPHVLWNVYTLETIKGCLRVGDPAGALATISYLRRVVPARWHRFINEGEVLGLLHHGKAEQAVARAICADPGSAYDEAAFRLHEITGMILLGHSLQALRRAVGLVAFLTQVQPQPHSKDATTLLRQLKQLSLLMEALDEPRYALAANLRGLEICADHDDQPLRFAFLATALRLAPTHPAALGWEREHRHLMDHCLYAEVRRGHSSATEMLHRSPFLDLITAVEGGVHIQRFPHLAGDDRVSVGASEAVSSSAAPRTDTGRLTMNPRAHPDPDTD